MASYVNPLVREKKQREPTYNMTRRELESMTKGAVLQGISAGMYICNATYAAAMLITLRDRLGFGQTRLHRIFDAVQELFREKVDSRISDTDLLQALKDECGITLEIHRPDGVRQDAIDLYKELEAPAKIVMRFTGK